VADENGDYFEIVKDSPDLVTIRAKLESNEYKSVTEWKTEVNLVWANASAAHGKSSLFRVIIKDLSDFFHKLTATLSDSAQNDWTDELQALGTEMTQIMRELTSPSSVQKVDLLKRSASTVLISDGAKAFGRDELVRLTRDITLIGDFGKLIELSLALKEMESDLQDNGVEIEVDLNHLRLQTLIMLRRKVDELLKR
jgi:hypothetical protein